MQPVSITLEDVGKRFGRQWLFRNVSLLFETGKAYALTGFNGSGKSTLLQIAYGYQTPSKGKILYNGIAANELFRFSGFVSPYLELPEELTLEEQLTFHFQFKKLRNNISMLQVAERCGLANHMDKQIRFFSSGMKQRLKLAQCFYADTPVLLLDEPCTNLDQNGIDWYREEIRQIKGERLVIIASNQTYEYDFCEQVIDVTTYR